MTEKPKLFDLVEVQRERRLQSETEALNQTTKTAKSYLDPEEAVTNFIEAFELAKPSELIDGIERQFQFAMTISQEDYLAVKSLVVTLEANGYTPDNLMGLAFSTAVGDILEDEIDLSAIKRLTIGTLSYEGFQNNRETLTFRTDVVVVQPKHNRKVKSTTGD